MALTQVANLEAEQQALRKLPQPRELDPAKAEALEKAREVLKRPWPSGESTTTSTQSSGGGQPTEGGASGTTNGVVPPTGNATASHTGTGGTGGTTSTSNSGGSSPKSGGTHTVDSSGQQTRTPGNTIDLGEIEKAKAIVTNLEKVGSKRELNPNEQQAYDRARGLLERESSAQTGTRDGTQRRGDRNTGNPKDLVMAGGDGPDHTQGAAADAPAPTVPAQPANAVGTTVEGPGAANPDAPKASAAVEGNSIPPAQTGPAGAAQTTATSTSTSASLPTGTLPQAVNSTEGGTRGTSSSTNKGQPSSTSSQANGKSKTKPKNSDTSSAQKGSTKKKPLNSPNPKKWVANGGTMDAGWTYTDKHGNKVPYPNGYPDFKAGGHVKAEVEIKQKGNRTTDFTDAIAANGGIQPPGTTWHHHENGTTMQAVDAEVHARFTHRGGVSIKNKGKRKKD